MLVGFKCRGLRARAAEETSTFVTEKWDRSPDDTVAVAEKTEEAVSAEEGEEVAVVDGVKNEPAEFLNKLDLKVMGLSLCLVLICLLNSRYGRGQIMHYDWVSW